MSENYQTRSESSGIKEFPSLALALNEIKKDKTIWKISFNAKNGERVRLIRFGDGNFDFESITGER